VSSPPVATPCSIDELRQIGLFGALSDDVLTYLCDTLQPVALGTGDVIFREGDAARDMYVVLHGELEVSKRSRSGHESRVAVLGVHDWFGEMSILDVQPRSATIQAVAPTRLLRIASSDLDALYRRDLKAYSLVVLNIARELSRRLRVADGILADFIAQVMDTYVARRKPLVRSLPVGRRGRGVRRRKGPQ
jgi:CRP/FNR family transcriptional regulator, cyclic AMP receptor protein